jgi:electron transfer flavoprotein alpha subunit
MSVLVVAEHDNASVADATLNVVTAASQLGSVTVLVAGSDCAGAAAGAANIADVSKVLVADDTAYDHGIAENISTLVVGLAGDYSHILLPATAYGKNIMPRIAALLDVAGISDITSIESDDTFVRPIYAGNAMQTVQSSDDIKLMTVRTTAFEPASEQGGSAASESLATGEVSDLVSFVGQDLTVTERPELTSARIVISGGRGMQSGDNFPMLDSIADKLGAAVGASRAAVDAGFVPNDYQVGQTGKIVAPDLYIAVGISGAIQHLAGMKDSKVIVAINKDEDAPIFQVADYGLVADLFEAIPELDAALD